MLVLIEVRYCTCNCNRKLQVTGREGFGHDKDRRGVTCR